MSRMLEVVLLILGLIFTVTAMSTMKSVPMSALEAEPLPISKPYDGLTDESKSREFQAVTPFSSSVPSETKFVSTPLVESISTTDSPTTEAESTYKSTTHRCERHGGNGAEVSTEKSTPKPVPFYISNLNGMFQMGPLVSHTNINVKIPINGMDRLSMNANITFNLESLFNNMLPLP